MWYATTFDRLHSKGALFPIGLTSYPDENKRGPKWGKNSYSKYHRGNGHKTDKYFNLRDVIQDMLMMVGFQSSCRGWKQAIKWATKQCLDYLKGSILLWFVTDYYICKGSFPNYRSNLHIFWNQWHTGQWWWRLSKRRMHPSSSRSLWWQQDYWHIRWSLCCRRRLIPIRHWKGRGASAY